MTEPNSPIVSDGPTISTEVKSPDLKTTAILQQLVEGVILTDAQGRITFVNQAANQLHGVVELGVAVENYTEAYHLLTMDGEPYPPEDLPLARAVLRTETVVNAFWRIQRPDGTEVIAQGDARPVLGDDGMQEGAVLTIRDVTAQHNAEQSAKAETRAREVVQRTLEEKREHLHRLLEASLDGVIEIDTDSHIVYWNAQAQIIFGWSREEVMGQVLADLVIPPGYRDRHMEGIRRFLRTGDGPLLDRRIEVTGLNRAGREFPIELTITPISTGGAVTFCAFVRDISDKLYAEQGLRDSERRFRTIIEQSPFSIQVFSPDGRTRLVNRTWEQLWGVTLDQIPEYNILEDPQLESKGIAAYIRRGFAGEPTAIPPILYDPNETIPGRTVHEDPGRWVAAFIYPVKDEAGNIREVILVHDDVTERLKAAEGLKKKAEEVAALNERLKRSIQETHHRVKNNLQIISALAELQTEEGQDTIPASAMHRMGQHTRSLAAIHDLLTQQVKADAHADFISAKAAMDKLIPLLRMTTGGRDISYTADDFRVPVQEGASLALLISELVSNAVKHGRDRIELTLALNGDMARLEICDDGPGFPPDFNPQSAANTGMSLIDSAGRHDLRGTITYENHRDGGARVVVAFPISRTQ